MPAFQKSKETILPAVTPEPAPTPSEDRLVAIPFDDVTVAVTEVNQPAAAVAVMEARQSEAITKELIAEANEDNLQADFVRNILAARNQSAAKEYTPPPIPEAIQRQTDLEMQAGRDAVARHAERAAANPRPKPQVNETMVPVFRPDDYVPDQKKGQGLVPNTTARSQNL